MPFPVVRGSWGQFLDRNCTRNAFFLFFCLSSCFARVRSIHFRPFASHSSSLWRVCCFPWTDRSFHAPTTCIDHPLPSTRRSDPLSCLRTHLLLARALWPWVWTLRFAPWRLVLRRIFVVRSCSCFDGVLSSQSCDVYRSPSVGAIGRVPWFDPNVRPNRPGFDPSFGGEGEGGGVIDGKNRTLDS